MGPTCRRKAWVIPQARIRPATMAIRPGPHSQITGFGGLRASQPALNLIPLISRRELRNPHSTPTQKPNS